MNESQYEDALRHVTGRGYGSSADFHEGVMSQKWSSVRSGFQEMVKSLRSQVASKCTGKQQQEILHKLQQAEFILNSRKVGPNDEIEVSYLVAAALASCMKSLFDAD